MKNQYVADIGDYGKYALLRAFADAGVRIGVNWYLTEDEEKKNDGHFTDYLKGNAFCRFHPEIFEKLCVIVDQKGKYKLIQDVMDADIIPGALFYADMLDPRGTSEERIRQRAGWFTRSIPALQDASLIYMDPDNGLLEKRTAGWKGAEKYILPEEAERYFLDGHNVVYYCHKGRRRFDAWLAYKSLLFERIPSAQPVILTYHQGTQRSYIFLIHEQDLAAYRAIISRFRFSWDWIFTEEYTTRDTPSLQLSKT